MNSAQISLNCDRISSQFVKFMNEYISKHPNSVLKQRPKIYRFETNLFKTSIYDYMLETFTSMKYFVDIDYTNPALASIHGSHRANKSNGQYRSAEVLATIDSKNLPLYWMYAYLYSMQPKSSTNRKIADGIDIDKPNIEPEDDYIWPGDIQEHTLEYVEVYKILNHLVCKPNLTDDEIKRAFDKFIVLLEICVSISLQYYGIVRIADNLDRSILYDDNNNIIFILTSENDKFVKKIYKDTMNYD